MRLRTFAVSAAALAALVSAPAALAAPPNDNFANATVITTVPYTQTLDTRTATLEPGETPHCPNSNHAPSVWYRFSSAVARRVQVSAAGSSYKAVVGVFQGTTMASLVELGCTHSSPPTAVSFDAVPGSTYYVRVMANLFGPPGGDLNLVLRPVLAPTNDDFANARVITTFPFKEAVDARTATQASDDPAASCADGLTLNTVWYSLTMPQRQLIKLSRSESADDAHTLTLAVYTGSRGALTQISCGKNFGNGGLSFTAQPGVQYFVALSAPSPTMVDDWVLSAEKGQFASTLEVHAPGKIAYGVAARVRIQLRQVDLSDSVNRLVSIYSLSRDGTSSQLIASGNLDESGELIAMLRPKTGLRYYAVWEGEARWARAQSVVKRVTVGSKTTVTFKGFRKRSGKYAVYRAGDDPVAVVRVFPGLPDREMEFTLSAFVRSSWVRLGRIEFKAGPRGTARVRIFNPAAGYRFRVFARFKGDASNPGSTSPVVNFRVAG